MIRPVTCPICKKSIATGADGPSRAFPFCSERCRQVDFFRWYDGKYAIVEDLDPALLDPEAFDPDAAPHRHFDDD